MAYTITEAQATTLLKIADALVGKKISKGMISESDRKDYIQELMLIMVQHQDDWTVPEGVSFEAYANTVMEKRLISIWRKKMAVKDVMAQACSLNTFFQLDSGEEEEYITLITEIDQRVNEGDNFRNWLRRKLFAEIRLFVANLPKEEQELCEALMYDTKAEVCRILGKGRPSVWRMIKRIRTKMIAEGLHTEIEKNSKIY